MCGKPVLRNISRSDRQRPGPAPDHRGKNREKQTYNIVQTNLSKKSGAPLLLLLVILLDQEEIKTQKKMLIKKINKRMMREKVVKNLMNKDPRNILSSKIYMMAIAFGWKIVENGKLEQKTEGERLR